MTVWTRRRRYRFLIAYGWAKARVLYDVRRPKLKFFWFELRYSFANLLNSFRPGTCAAVLFEGASEIQTRREGLRVRPGTQDAAIASPAFERSDFEYLVRRARDLLRQGPVDFIDVGANIGQFSVRLPKRLGANAALRVHAFEPVPQNLELLRWNLAANHVDRVDVHAVALSDRDGVLPMRFNSKRAGDSMLLTRATADSIEVPVRRADDVLTSLAPGTSQLVKIDVEGHELGVLRGFKETFGRARSVDLCVEDIFHVEALYGYLRGEGFVLVDKLTPYNSWWRKTTH